MSPPFINYKNYTNKRQMEINRGQEIIRKYYAKSIIGIILSGILILASLYQLEIIFIWGIQKRLTFEFPFFLWTTNLWVARDIWYTIMIIGWILAAYSGFKLGEIREFENLIEDPKDAEIIQEIIQEHRENKRKIT